MWSPLKTGRFEEYRPEHLVGFYISKSLTCPIRVMKYLFGMLFQLDTMYGRINVAEMSIQHVGEWFKDF